MKRLTEDQMRAFARDGYVVVTNVVAEDLLAAADAEIDELIAAEPPERGEWNRHSYWPKPDRLPRCNDALRRSGALELAEQLVAPYRLENEVDHIQVAVNFPNSPHIPAGPHIDCHILGAEEPHSFSVLVGLYLGDESEPGRGNLYEWPGSHFDHARLFAERGLNVLLQNGGHATMLDPPMALGPGVPVLARRGDIVLSHRLTGHNASGNETDAMRRIVYFRLACEGHLTRWSETFLDPLTEYTPLRRLVEGD